MPIDSNHGIYRGENPEPGKDVHGELDPRPGIREQPRSNSVLRRCPRLVRFASCFDYKADIAALRIRGQEETLRPMGLKMGNGC